MPTSKQCINTLFQVSLSENPSTGFTLQFATTPGLEIVSSVFIPGSGIGAAGMRVLTLRAVRLGCQTLVSLAVPPSGDITNFNPVIMQYKIVCC